MNPKFLLAFLLIPSVGACVTTREELNRQREAAAELDAKPIKSEELLKPEANAPVAAAPAQSPARAPVETAQPVPVPVKTDPTTLSEDELRAELARANGRLEEMQHEQEIKEKSTGEDLKKAQERIAALEKQLKELTPETVAVPEGKTPLEAGKDSYGEGKYEEAIVFFSRFLSGQDSGKQVEEATFLRESLISKNSSTIRPFSTSPNSLKSSRNPRFIRRPC